MYKEFYPLNSKVRIVKRRYKKDESLPTDGFRVIIDEEGICSIAYQNLRAKEYAKRAVRSLSEEDGYPVCYLKDYPSFPLRGIVEGFYGKPYTHEQRLALPKLLSGLRMNAYIYAPKDDLYHRDRWREDYPAGEEEKLKELFLSAQKEGVDFFFAISPGKDFDFANQHDYEILLRKLEKVRAFGVRHFSLLMDDIEPKLSDKEKELFSSPAEAQAHLANYLLKSLSPAKPFLFCPTDYMQNFDTPYRQELRKHLDKDIEVFWTGYNTVAEAITEEDGETVTETFHRKPVLWDNYPVNDFEPKRRVYLGALTGRGRKLNQSHIGYIANLSELFECSKIPLTTMADYAWDCEGYNPEESLKKAVRAYFKGCVRAGEIFVALNEGTIMSAPKKTARLFEKKNFDALDKRYKKIEWALKQLQEKAPEEFLEETESLRTFLSTECALYKAARRGASEEEIAPLKEVLNGCKYAPYDLSLLAYVNSMYALNDPFKVDAERVIYRKWGKKHD